MIYFFDYGDEEDQPNKESWGLYSWFIPLNKGKLKTGSKGVRIFPDRNLYDFTEVLMGDNLTPAPFITEDMMRHFVSGIFLAEPSIRE